VLTVLETVVVALVLLAVGALLGVGVALGVAAVRWALGTPRRRAHVAQLSRRRRRVALASARLADSATEVLPCYRPGTAPATTPGHSRPAPAPTQVFPRVDYPRALGTPARRAAAPDWRPLGTVSRPGGRL
jgi:hypothetical protein